MIKDVLPFRNFSVSLAARLALIVSVSLGGGVRDLVDYYIYIGEGCDICAHLAVFVFVDRCVVNFWY